MNKKITVLLLVALAFVATYSYLNIPDKYAIEGGSCYQGITTMFIRFFLGICAILNILAIIAVTFKSKFKAAKILSIISFLIWSFGTFIHSQSDAIMGITYFTPFLLLNFVIIISIYKMEKKERII